MRNFAPQTVQFNERAVGRRQGDFDGAPDFGAGAFKDLHGSAVPANGVHHSENYKIFNKRCIPRDGTQKWSDTLIPSLRTGYSVTKSGYIVTATVGANFTVADVGRYIRYDDGAFERIAAVIDTTHVRVEGTTTHAASTAAAIYDKPNGHEFHWRRRKIVLHIGARLFVSNTVNIYSWQQAYHVGTTALSNNPSIFEERGDWMFIFNSNGIFKINLNTDDYVYFKTNCDVPTTLITETAEDKYASTPLIYGRRYNYAMERLTGTDVTRQATDSDVTVEQISGPCFPNADFRDYGEVYTARPVGDGSTYYGVLTGGSLGANYDTAAEWAAINDGVFAITINSTAVNVECDFSKCVSMADVAQVIQDALRQYFSEVTCVYVTDHFVITSPTEDGTIGYTSVGAGGTDIGATAMSCESGTGTLTTPGYTAESTIGTLTYPSENGPWTHYKINCTLDIGDNGVDPNTGEGNNKELYIYNRSHPVAKAFVAKIESNVIIASSGAFEQTDEGDTFKFQDGTEVTIVSYTDSTHVTCSNADVAEQPACLGGGDVMTASQNGTTVTRTAGHTFAAGDVGKMLFWGNGQITVITAYTNANSVEATPPAGAAFIPNCGLTLDPVSRTYRDRVRDETLRPRAAGLSLKNRYHSAMPDCDVGSICGGIIIGAVRGLEKIYYSQIPEGDLAYAGFYDSYKQEAIFKDRIECFAKYRDDLAIIQRNRTDSVPINTFATDTRKSVGEEILILAGQNVVDEELGCKDFGLLRKIGRDLFEMINQDSGLRQLGYNGGQLQYSDNLAKNRYHKEFQRFIDGTGTSSYDPINGYMCWAFYEDSTTTLDLGGVYHLIDTPDIGDEYEDTDDEGDEYREVM